MKLLAGRNRDRQDVATLAEHLKLKEPGDAIRIYKDLFPDEEFKPQARQLLDWTFRARAREHERDTGPSRWRQGPDSSARGFGSPVDSRSE